MPTTRASSSLHFTLPLKDADRREEAVLVPDLRPDVFRLLRDRQDKEATLVGAPPGCSLSAVDPQPLVAADAPKLSQAASDNFSPGADLSVKLTTRIIVACP